MDDLFTNIDRRPERIQGNLHNVDRAHHSRTEAARLQQKNAFGRGAGYALINIAGCESRGIHIPSIPFLKGVSTLG